jgi:hypothetical protein
MMNKKNSLTERCRRIRNVRQGPCGEIYLVTAEDPGDIVR